MSSTLHSSVESRNIDIGENIGCQNEKLQHVFRTVAVSWHHHGKSAVPDTFLCHPAACMAAHHAEHGLEDLQQDGRPGKLLRLLRQKAEHSLVLSHQRTFQPPAFRTPAGAFA